MMVIVIPIYNALFFNFLQYDDHYDHGSDFLNTCPFAHSPLSIMGKGLDGSFEKYTVGVDVQRHEQVVFRCTDLIRTVVIADPCPL